MHFLYIDESGSTGKDLKSVEQPIFTMAGLLVSDEKWRETERLVIQALTSEFPGGLPNNFELHATDLLGTQGAGPFDGWERERRNQLARTLLEVAADRTQILMLSLNKEKIAASTPPKEDYRFNARDPWQISFALLLTEFEEFLRGPLTGSSSAGLVIIDHEPAFLQFVRDYCLHRRNAGGWQTLRKVTEVGYSIESHANSLIQLADLVAYTLRKSEELRTGHSQGWSAEAQAFYQDSRRILWPKVRLKTAKFSKIKPPEKLLSYIKNIRS